VNLFRLLGLPIPCLVTKAPAFGYFNRSMRRWEPPSERTEHVIGVPVTANDSLQDVVKQIDRRLFDLKYRCGIETM